MTLRLEDVFMETREFTERELEDLMVIIHDKRHLAIGEGKPVPAIDKALRLHAESTQKLLYRGLAKKVDARVGSVLKFAGYSSFSEDRDVSWNFATTYGSNTLLELLGARGFCYWKWYVAQEEKSRVEDPEGFDASDGDYMIQSAKDEAEWLLPRNSKFRVTGVRDDGGMTIFSVELV